LVRNIFKDTTGGRTTIVLSTSVVIIANNLSVLTRRSRDTIRITRVSSTFAIVITFYFFIDTSPQRITIYRIASIFVFTFILFIIASPKMTA